MEKLMVMEFVLVQRDKGNIQDLGILVLKFLEFTLGQGN
jgi:hypothetical protein